MNDERVEVHGPCSLGFIYRHGREVHKGGNTCDGSSRRTLAVGSFVLVETVNGRWPQEVEHAVVSGLSMWSHVGKDTIYYTELLLRARRVLDALAAVAGKDT